MRFKYILIAFIFVFGSCQADTYNDEEIIERAQLMYQKSVKLMEGRELPAVSVNPYAGQYDARISAMHEDGKQKIKRYLEGRGESIEGFASTDGANLFVLVSFSMPDKLIQQYITEAAKYKASVVVIGLVENDFMATQKKIQGLVGKSNKGGIMIDPNLFMTYKVESVPAVLLTSDKYPCESSRCQSGSFDIMYGSVHIKYALESFKSSGEMSQNAETRLAVSQ